MSEHPVFDAGILQGVHLLEADAGTGKTWTIAGLVVRALVERGLDIDRVLVVTFTNAATAELAARIRQRIAQLERLLDDRLEGRDEAGRAGIDEAFCVAYSARLDDARAHQARSSLRVALARIDEMAVHTIHGYCQRVIDEHALSIGVARGLPIRTGADERVGRRVADWWRAEVLDASPERLRLIAFAGLTPAGLVEAVRSIVALPLARVEPQAADWRALALRLEAACASLVAAVRTECDSLQDWLAVKGNVDGRRFSTRHVAGWIARLRGFCEDPDPAEIPDALEKFATVRFDGRSLQSTIPACCDALLEIRDELRRVRGWIAQEIAVALDATRDLDLADAASLGFDDLLRLVRDALADPASGPGLARALRERHPVALIDECQDTDALQWEIVRRVHIDSAPAAGEPPGALVLVGDPKQAIYACRGADLPSYLQARDAATNRHRLGENQRSSRALIESVNALFDCRHPFLVEEIGFAPAGFGQRRRRAFDAGDEGDAGDAGARAPMTVVRLEPDPQTGSLSAGAARGQAVQASVAEIARLLGGSARYDERELRPGDIAVLVNTHRQGSQIKRALAARGIGAAEISRDSVLDTLECAELVRVIAAIAEPADAGRLRSAWTTTLFGADAATLAALDRDGAPVLDIAARFTQAHETWLRLGPIAALRPLLRAYDVGARLGALRDGDRRLTNLMHLMTLLADDDAALRGPQQALHLWSRLRADRASREAETGELRLESDDDLVRILTVHKSKGLEFPVVFLPFAWSAKAADVGNPCRRHERDAAGCWHAVLDFAPSDESVEQAAREWHAENLRTLYVALTRAEQRCYLFWGAAKNAQYAPLAWLLHGQDPSTASPSADGALAADAIVHTLGQWRDRANTRHEAAIALVDTPTLSAGCDEAMTMPEFACANGVAQSTSDPDLAGHGEHPAASALDARPWRGTIGAPSITTSFSAMASQLAFSEASTGWRASDLVERPDHDQQSPRDDAVSALHEDAAAARAMRFRFPAGAQAGVCLHGILEEVAFDTLPAHDLVARWLARCGFARLDAREVADWLSQVLETPLRTVRGDTIELARIPAFRQIREMDFHLSGHRVADRAVLEAVASEYALEPSNSASRWSGFLRGFIDLVFEHGGRYYLVDWKSNHLGDRTEHYAAEPLEMAMRTHAYPLQACLYTLALHRWLRRTVAGYDYQRHFGGVFYVFLRGAGLEAKGALQPGVHASRPSERLVATLDRIFAAGSGTGRL